MQTMSSIPAPRDLIGLGVNGVENDLFGLKNALAGPERDTSSSRRKSGNSLMVALIFHCYIVSRPSIGASHIGHRFSRVREY